MKSQGNEKYIAVVSSVVSDSGPTFSWLDLESNQQVYHVIDLENLKLDKFLFLWQGCSKRIVYTKIW